MTSVPSTIIATPGITNWRQPSRKLDSFDTPERGRYSIGTSLIRSPPLEARMTISDANSMPVVRRSSAGSSSRRTARIPQWASFTPVRKSRFRSPVRIGLPT
jgi:hypothetical protein